MDTLNLLLDTNVLHIDVVPLTKVTARTTTNRVSAGCENTIKCLRCCVFEPNNLAIPRGAKMPATTAWRRCRRYSVPDTRRVSCSGCNIQKPKTFDILLYNAASTLSWNPNTTPI